MSLRKTLEYRKLHFTAVTTRKYECEEQTFRVMCRVSRIQTTASLSDDNNSSLYCGLSPENHVHNNQLVIQSTLDKSNHQGKLNKVRIIGNLSYREQMTGNTVYILSDLTVKKSSEN